MPNCINRGDYLFVENFESFSSKALFGLIQEISEHCKRESLDKVLVDLREIRGHISIVDRYELGKEIAKVIGPKIKVAAVAQMNLINYLMENSAVNRGAKIRVFTEIKKALEWLEVKEQQENPSTISPPAG
ncbi:MAG: hypothetical protein HYZ21_02095 [Chloroflexi bacterium]|nr:hypothetical protein [Chloroflexota bacterium]